MRIYPTLLIVGFFCFLGCNEKESNTYTLESTGEIISLELDNKTSNVSQGFSTYDDLLFNVVWETNQIQVYDINSKQLIKKLNFDIEGDQGVGEIFGFHIHNLDSIFLFGQNTSVIHLTDTTGTVKDRIKYKIPDGYTAAFVHPGYFISSPRLHSNEIMVKTHITGNYREVSNKDLKEKHMAFGINLETGDTRFMNHTYPHDYLAEGLKHFEASMAIGKDKIVYSLFGDHRLFFAESFDQNLQSKNVASEFLDERLKLFPLDGERMDTYHYLNTSSRYDNLVYDSYRDLYYRFAYPSIEVTDESELQRLRIAPGPFVIMILDNNLDILGETYFEKGKYMPNNFFIHKDGIYLSINHPDNPDNIEDEFKFELLKVSEN